MDIEGREEASAFTGCQSRCKKGHMMNIYLTDLDEETIVDIAKDHEEHYDKTKDKASKDCLWETFASTARSQ